MFIVANHHVDQRNGVKPGAEMCIALPRVLRCDDDTNKTGTHASKHCIVTWSKTPVK